mmetsp:Transcript_135974/g.290635  ORF Transcript_135974/g.290635 Transcript_135974/m.290635 type:complete len:142 (-) Transcript_135974:317-742(-)
MESLPESECLREVLESPIVTTSSSAKAKTDHNVEITESEKVVLSKATPQLPIKLIDASGSIIAEIHCSPTMTISSVKSFIEQKLNMTMNNHELVSHSTVLHNSEKLMDVPEPVELTLVSRWGHQKPECHRRMGGYCCFSKF